MGIKKILIYFVVIVAVIALFLYFRSKKTVNTLPVIAPTPTIEQKIESKLKGFTIPIDAERIELKDVSGGDSFGIATRNEIMADLPEPTLGQYYQAYLEKEGKTVVLGRMEEGKGGWIVSYDSSKFPGYNKVIVMLGAKHILEGSF
jgi:hypothetical protein